MDKNEELNNSNPLNNQDPQINNGDSLREPLLPLDPALIQTPLSDESPFVSNFKRWIRPVAIIVLLVFVPDQASWAFGYNPAVIYKNLTNTQALLGVDEMMISPKLLPQQAQVADSVEYLFKQIENKEPLRVQLNLDNAPTALKHTLEVETRNVFTHQKVKEIGQWLSDPDIKSETCGVYALQGILNNNGIKRSLQEVAVLTAATDLMANIIKVGEPKLKTTLFSINKVGSALGLTYKPMKVDVEDELKLPVPFIANIKGEHFVTVKNVTEEKVYVEDLGRVQTLDRSDFEKGLNGFVYSQTPSKDNNSEAKSTIHNLQDMASFLKAPEQNYEAIHYDVLPDSLQAFVWGDKWANKSQQLPGFTNKTQLFITLAIELLAALLPYLGQISGVSAGLSESGGMIGRALGSITSYSALTGILAGQIAGDIVTICELKGICSAKNAFILQIALSAAISAGAGALMSSYSETVATTAADAGTNAAVNAGTSTATATATTTTTTTLLNSFSNAFFQGFEFGLIKGFIQYYVVQYLNEAICGSKDSSKCSDGQSIISQTLGSIITAFLAGQVQAGVAYVQDWASNGVAGSGKFLGVNTGSNQNLSDDQEIQAQAQADAKANAASDQATKGMDANDPKTEQVGDKTYMKVYDAQYHAYTVANGTDWQASSFHDLESSVLKGVLPSVLGQLGGAAARYVALQAGVKSDSGLSTAIGSGVSMLVSTGYQALADKDTPTNWGRMFLVGAINASVGIGLGAIEDSVIKNPGKSASASAQMQYQNTIAEFRAATWVASSVVTTAIVAGVDNFSGDYKNPNPLTQGTEDAEGNNKEAPKPTSAWTRFWGGLSSQTGPMESGLNGFTGGNYMTTFIKSGSFGSVQNFNAYLDTLSSNNGYTADSAIKKELMWKSLKSSNDSITGQPTGYTMAGGLIAPDYINAPKKQSADMIHAQYIVNMMNSGMLYNGMMPMSSILSGLQQAEITSVKMLPGAIALGLMSASGADEETKAKTSRVLNDIGLEVPRLFTRYGQDGAGNMVPRFFFELPDANRSDTYGGEDYNGTYFSVSTYLPGTMFSKDGKYSKYLTGKDAGKDGSPYLEGVYDKTFSDPGMTWVQLGRYMGTYTDNSGINLPTGQASSTGKGLPSAQSLLGLSDDTSNSNMGAAKGIIAFDLTNDQSITMVAKEGTKTFKRTNTDDVNGKAVDNGKGPSVESGSIKWNPFYDRRATAIKDGVDVDLRANNKLALSPGADLAQPLTSLGVPDYNFFTGLAEENGKGDSVSMVSYDSHGKLISYTNEAYQQPGSQRAASGFYQLAVGDNVSDFLVQGNKQVASGEYYTAQGFKTDINTKMDYSNPNYYEKDGKGKMWLDMTGDDFITGDIKQSGNESTAKIAGQAIGQFGDFQTAENKKAGETATSIMTLDVGKGENGQGLIYSADLSKARITSGQVYVLGAGAKSANKEAADEKEGDKFDNSNTSAKKLSSAFQGMGISLYGLGAGDSIAINGIMPVDPVPPPQPASGKGSPNVSDDPNAQFNKEKDKDPLNRKGLAYSTGNMLTLGSPIGDNYIDKDGHISLGPVAQGAYVPETTYAKAATPTAKPVDMTINSGGDTTDDEKDTLTRERNAAQTGAGQSPTPVSAIPQTGAPLPITAANNPNASFAEIFRSSLTGPNVQNNFQTPISAAPAGVFPSWNDVSVTTPQTGGIQPATPAADTTAPAASSTGGVPLPITAANNPNASFAEIFKSSLTGPNVQNNFQTPISAAPAGVFPSWNDVSVTTPTGGIQPATPAASQDKPAETTGLTTGTDLATSYATAMAVARSSAEISNLWKKLGLPDQTEVAVAKTPEEAGDRSLQMGVWYSRGGSYAKSLFENSDAEKSPQAAAPASSQDKPTETTGLTTGTDLATSYATAMATVRSSAEISNLLKKLDLLPDQTEVAVAKTPEEAGDRALQMGVWYSRGVSYAKSLFEKSDAEKSPQEATPAASQDKPAKTTPPAAPAIPLGFNPIDFNEPQGQTTIDSQGRMTGAGRMSVANDTSTFSYRGLPGSLSIADGASRIDPTHISIENAGVFKSNGSGNVFDSDINIKIAKDGTLIFSGNGDTHDFHGTIEVGPGETRIIGSNQNDALASTGSSLVGREAGYHDAIPSGAPDPKTGLPVGSKQTPTPGISAADQLAAFPIPNYDAETNKPIEPQQTRSSILTGFSRNDFLAATSTSNAGTIAPDAAPLGAAVGTVREEPKLAGLATPGANAPAGIIGASVDKDKEATDSARIPLTNIDLSGDKMLKGSYQGAPVGDAYKASYITIAPTGERTVVQQIIAPSISRSQADYDAITQATMDAVATGVTPSLEEVFKSSDDIYAQSFRNDFFYNRGISPSKTNEVRALEGYGKGAWQAASDYSAESPFDPFLYTPAQAKGLSKPGKDSSHKDYGTDASVGANDATGVTLIDANGKAIKGKVNVYDISTHMTPDEKQGYVGYSDKGQHISDNARYTTSGPSVGNDSNFVQTEGNIPGRDYYNDRQDGDNLTVKVPGLGNVNIAKGSEVFQNGDVSFTLGTKAQISKNASLWDPAINGAGIKYVEFGKNNSMTVLSDASNGGWSLLPDGQKIKTSYESDGDVQTVTREMQGNISGKDSKTKIEANHLVNLVVAGPIEWGSKGALSIPSQSQVGPTSSDTITPTATGSEAAITQIQGILKDRFGVEPAMNISKGEGKLTLDSFTLPVDMSTFDKTHFVVFSGAGEGTGEKAGKITDFRVAEESGNGGDSGGLKVSQRNVQSSNVLGTSLNIDQAVESKGGKLEYELNNMVTAPKSTERLIGSTFSLPGKKEGTLEDDSTKINVGGKVVTLDRSSDAAAVRLVPGSKEDGGMKLENLDAKGAPIPTEDPSIAKARAWMNAGPTFMSSLLDKSITLESLTGRKFEPNRKDFYQATYNKDTDFFQEVFLSGGKIFQHVQAPSVSMEQAGKVADAVQTFHSIFGHSVDTEAIAQGIYNAGYRND